MELSLRRARWVRLATLAVAINAVVGACGPRSDASVPHPTPRPSTSVTAAVTQWMRDGGSADIVTLATDFTNIGNNAGQDATLFTGCQRLLADVRTAQAYAPIPDPVSQRQWAGALDLYSHGAADCAQGARTHDYAAIIHAANEITTGTNKIHGVTARLKLLTGR
jgi:hypothetical protein